MILFLPTMLILIVLLFYRIILINKILRYKTELQNEGENKEMVFWINGRTGHLPNSEEFVDAVSTWCDRDNPSDSLRKQRDKIFILKVYKYRKIEKIFFRFLMIYIILSIVVVFIVTYF